MAVFRSLLPGSRRTAGSWLLVLGYAVCFTSAQAADPVYREIEFADLLPDEDFKALSNPPAELAAIADGSEEDQIDAALGQGEAGKNPDQPQTDWHRALQSTNIRAEFNGQKVRIPGYIVPLEFDDQQVVTEFFLVPYYGACIHLPPPPPNQLILGKSSDGVMLETIYDPFWIEGTLLTEVNKNDVATSAYRMTVEQIIPYKMQ